MPQKQFTIAELEALVVSKGKGSKVPQARPLSRVVPYQPPALKRDIQRSIYNAVYNEGRAVSRREIAYCIGVKKTTWLDAHIERLVSDRHLIRTQMPYRPGIVIYFYTVAP